MPKSKKTLDFIVVGAQKSGTTALNRYFKAHPEIGVPKGKELHFFDSGDFNHSNGYAKLENKINVTPETKVRGEITPIYMFWEPCMRRIWRYNKDIKVICIMRNPIKRAFSHWNMNKQMDVDFPDFKECILNENKYAAETLPIQHRIFSMISRGFYSEQIRRIQRLFPADQTLFIKYEDYVEHQEQYLERVFNFLGVDPSKFKYEQQTVHKREYARKITDEEIMMLKEMYQYDIKEVERLLNWNCSDWLN